MNCEIPNCKRRATRIMETVGLGKAVYSCGYCCKSSVYYYVEHYGSDSVIEVQNPHQWKPVEYHEEFVMVWCKYDSK